MACSMHAVVHFFGGGRTSYADTVKGLIWSLWLLPTSLFVMCTVKIDSIVIMIIMVFAIIVIVVIGC